MAKAILIWATLATTIAAALFAAATSPLLAWRDPVYIAAGLAGVIALALMLLQPLLAGNLLPGLALYTSRRLHRLIGPTLVLAVIAHVAGLWITSPPDVIDALTFTSPTPFSAWGVIAMWTLFATALLATSRRKLRLRTWRLAHKTLAFVIVTATALHALLIQGTMGTLSKTALCALTLLATLTAILTLRRRAGP